MSLKYIEKKVLSGERLTPDEALTLFESDDIFTIGRLADYVAIRRNGNNAYFIRNHHINPTNICINRCRFCAFSRSKGEKGAYELSIEEIIKKLEKQESGVKSQESRIKIIEDQNNKRRHVTHGSEPACQTGEHCTPYSEVHIVGGLHPEWDLDYYTEMLRQIKTRFPYLRIKAFTAVEIEYLSRISGRTVRKTIEILKDAGLEMMPGGGAEIFNSRLRNKVCPEKISGRRWLEVMETAHRMGIKTNATMLYGHVEKFKHRVDHMNKLRDLQDRTGGFQAFIPLAFHPVNTELTAGSQESKVRSRKSRGKSYELSSCELSFTSGIDDLKTIAIARLFLDNFPHIKAYWIMLGEKIAQLALRFGADDLDGTIVEERITHAAGGTTGQVMTRDELVYLIERAGKVPVERDSFYNHVQ